MRFRVLSGELNQVVNYDMLFKDFTQKILWEIIKKAFEQEKRKDLNVGTLLSVAPIPHKRDEIYYISTKAVVEKLNLENKN